MRKEGEEGGEEGWGCLGRKGQKERVEERRSGVPWEDEVEKGKRRREGRKEGMEEKGIGSEKKVF